MRKLNDAQRALVEQYHRVIYVLLSRYGLPVDEYYDIAAERLCQAALSYTGDGSGFFSYAYKAVSHALSVADKRDRKYRELTVPYSDFVYCRYNPFSYVLDKTYVENVIGICVSFMTQREIAAMKRVLKGVQSRNQSEFSARDRALKKYRLYLSGHAFGKKNPNLDSREPERKVRNQKIIELRNKGVGYTEVAAKFNISGRLVRDVYRKWKLAQGI